jgi:sulfur carrier protein ThiS
MKITVKLVGRLGRSTQAGSRAITVAEGTTVEAVIKELSLREGDVWLTTVNGQYAHRDQHLQEGDELVLVPPVGGGD